MAKKANVQSFEKGLAELETIQEKLSAGELPLDKAIAEYERGVTVLKDCYGILDKAEKKIAVLTADGKGGLKEEPMASEDKEDEEPGLF